VVYRKEELLEAPNIRETGMRRRHHRAVFSPAKTVADCFQPPLLLCLTYESFLGGCYAEAEQLNASAWSFGQFVRELFCGWIKAR
jgi:hypothetical protein